MRRAILAIIVAALGITAAPVVAQPGPGPGAPEAAFQFRLGWFMPTADSDFWDETFDVFTLGGSDFDDFILGFTYVHSVSNEVEIGLNLDFYDEKARSQYRDWVDAVGRPILHDTDLELIPLTVDIRFIPGGRYRIRPGGRYIIKPLFYLGAGMGVNFWNYEEVGDFLDFDFDPPVVFGTRFVDDGVAFEFHLLAGVEIPVGRTSNLLFEVRHSVSEDSLGGAFAGLTATDLDLGGTTIGGGLSLRF